MKVYRDLLVTASKNKQINNLRYMLALRQFGRGDGSVNVTEAVTTLAGAFGVKPKTVLNRLHTCVSLGYGNFNPSGKRFYYYSQARLLNAMGGTLTSKVSIDINDFSGSVVTVRARFHAALLASHKAEITVTRGTIQNWSGRAKRTQRQYEKLSGVGVKANFAYLQEYTGKSYDLARARYWGHAAFIHKNTRTGKHYIAKQLANTYTIPNFVKGKLRRDQPCVIVGGGTDKRVYFKNLDDGIAQWQRNGKTNDLYVRNETTGQWDWFDGLPRNVTA